MFDSKKFVNDFFSQGQFADESERAIAVEFINQIIDKYKIEFTQESIRDTMARGNESKLKMFFSDGEVKVENKEETKVTVRNYNPKTEYYDYFYIIFGKESDVRIEALKCLNSDDKCLWSYELNRTPSVKYYNAKTYGLASAANDMSLAIPDKEYEIYDDGTVKGPQERIKEAIGMIKLLQDEMDTVKTKKLEKQDI